MSLFAIVPVKPFSLSKSRLSSILSTQQRVELSRRLLNHTLRVLANVPEVKRTLVISRDPAALAFARKHQAKAIPELGVGKLNTALTQATWAAKASGAEAILILPADLPLLSEEAVRQFIAESQTEPLIAIAPDRHEEGTNALLLRPPNLINYAFGEHSFQRHIAQAEQAGVPVRICCLPELALDLDTPEDLNLLTPFPGRIST